MRLPISIVIPTFNEKYFLPKLLESIKKQTKKPEEIIVADAFSDDNTRKIAKKFGAKVVDGGLPAISRNNGARKASSSIILFLDSDVVLPKKFLEQTFEEIAGRYLDITSCFLSPRSNLKLDHFLHDFVNNYMKITQRFHPHIPGACIFVKKGLHEKIGGFDESILVAEDHDYVKRCKRFGKFAYLKSYKLPISVRRLTRDGRIRIALKYIAIELHLIFLGQIRKNIFKYTFGNYYKPKRVLA